ncbi:hypothetical protein HDU76_005596 [Blyttiomyces sp. JEL0837]|nr:hypothetical protein HDU76_005596 [Blyttiomyces sp. JEL0837]
MKPPNRILRKHWRAKLECDLDAYSNEVAKASNDVEQVLKLKSHCIYQFMREICVVLDSKDDNSGCGGQWSETFAQVEKNTARGCDLLSMLLFLLHTNQEWHYKVRFKIEENEAGHAGCVEDTIGGSGKEEGETYTIRIHSRNDSISTDCTYALASEYHKQDSVNSAGKIFQDKALLKLSVRSLKRCVVTCKNMKGSKLNLDNAWIVTKSLINETLRKMDSDPTNCWGHDSVVIDESLKDLKKRLAGVRENLQDLHARIVTIHRFIGLWRSSNMRMLGGPSTQ